MTAAITIQLTEEMVQAIERDGYYDSGWRGPTAVEAAMIREFAILGEFFAAVEAAQTPDDGNLAGLDLAPSESDSLALERWEAEGGSWE